MRYGVKLFFCILGIVIFVFGAISSIIFEDSKNIFLAVILGLAAFVDAFVFMLPLIVSNGKIKIPQINYFSANYDRKTFVDRKDSIKEIRKIINDKNEKKICLIKLHGELGVGRRAIIGKLYTIYWGPWNKWLFIDNSDSSVIESIKTTYKYEGNFSDGSLYKQLGKTPRVFVVLRNEISDDNLLNKFMSNWDISNKNKLILITYDTNYVESKTGTFVCDVTIPSLDAKYSSRLSKKLFAKNAGSDASDMAKGNPLIIKQICKLSKGSTELRILSDPLSCIGERDKSVIYELFLVYLSNGFIDKRHLDRYRSNVIATIINNSILLQYGDTCYISPFVFRSILDNHTYRMELSNVYLNFKGEDTSLSLDRDIIDIYLDENNAYSKLLFLKKNERYIEIKAIFINLMYKLEFEIEKNKILIFLDALLKLGDYDLFKKYYETLDHPSPLQNKMSLEDIEFNLLLADYYHLTSDYKSSNFILQQLKDKVDNFKVTFMLAHNYRHMGELKKAKEEFENINLSECSDDFLLARTISEIFSIEYVNNEIKYETLDKLSDLSDGKESFKYNIIRHLAIVKMLQNNYSEAKQLLEDAIDELENEPLRILQDFYFEIAECYRLDYSLSDYSKATNYYKKAIIFSEMNKDKNLEICSKIGYALLEYNRYGNRKKTVKILKSYLTTANNLSKLIYAGVDTAIRILLGSNDNPNSLTEQDFAYYANILINSDIRNLKIFVM